LISHAEALEQMGPYFSNTLDREQVRAFHAHVNDCEDCRLRLRVMRSTLPRPGFTLAADQEREAKLQLILQRNRIMIYAVVAILACFFFFFRLKRG
jgi:hypothetical protein